MHPYIATFSGLGKTHRIFSLSSMIYIVSIPNHVDYAWKIFCFTVSGPRSSLKQIVTDFVTRDRFRQDSLVFPDFHPLFVFLTSHFLLFLKFICKLFSLHSDLPNLFSHETFRFLHLRLLRPSGHSHRSMNACCPFLHDTNSCPISRSSTGRGSFCQSINSFSHRFHFQSLNAREFNDDPPLNYVNLSKLKARNSNSSPFPIFSSPFFLTIVSKIHPQAIFIIFSTPKSLPS
jgi:hypothetical protein